MESDPPASATEGQQQRVSNEPTTASDQLDNLSNLLINGSWEDEVLDQYENETEKTINEHLQVERDQSTQKLFQSFQTSACAVAQMFKDKTLPPQTPWQSFQNSAGAITVLYKDSLEACKAHYDIGVSTGQQRKVKELINWLKKKKRRNIRKDELISFLIGKQLPAAAAGSAPSMFAFALNPNNFAGTSPASFNHQASSSSTFNNQNRRQALSRQQQTAVLRNTATSNSSAFGGGSVTLPSSSIASNLNSQQQSQVSIINSSSNQPSANVADANYSDLATFREALIMHNRSRAAPLNHHHTSFHHHQNHNHHHYRNVSQPPSSNVLASASTNANSNTVSAVNTQGPPGQMPPPPNCDDLDCFFCEQIATHIEHKRSASSLSSNSLNLDMESPTRKRGRFY